MFKVGETVICVDAGASLQHGKAYKITEVKDGEFVKIAGNDYYKRANRFKRPEAVFEEKGMKVIKRFKPGDRVRCVKGSNNLIEGRHYIVSEYIGLHKGQWLLRVQGSTNQFYEHRFELAEPEVTFKPGEPVKKFTVGQKVLCIDEKNGVKFGDVYVIRKYADYTGDKHIVFVEGDTEGYYESRFQAWSPSMPAAPNPATPGIYQIKTTNKTSEFSAWYSFWDGSTWSAASACPGDVIGPFRHRPYNKEDGVIMDWQAITMPALMPAAKKSSDPGRSAPGVGSHRRGAARHTVLLT